MTRRPARLPQRDERKIVQEGLACIYGMYILSLMNNDATLVRMMKELQSDLADLVESSDLTEEEANEWANMKADQWAQK